MANLVLLIALLLPRLAHAICDVIPGVQGTFRAALGTVDRPFARPGDPVELRLDPTCDGRSPGFGSTASDHVVTVLFQPPAGPANAVALAPDCTGFAAARNRCEAQLGGGTATCIPAGDAVTIVERDGTRRLRVRFPDTDGLFATPGDPSSAADGRTFTGPAALAVTTPGDDLPCGLATTSCRDILGLTACVDELLADDGACGTTAPHSLFGHFTALPPPNDFGALCTTPSPPCTGQLGEAHLTVDRAGNLLVPMDWRRVLVRRADVPVARLLRGSVGLEAFEGSGMPLRLPDDSVLGSFSLRGVPLPPIFSPQSDPTGGDAVALFGTADAPEGVLRIARRRTCDGGDVPGRPCDTDAACPGGACGAGLFDFAGRLAGGVGPLVLRRGACLGGTRPIASCAAAGDCPGGQCIDLHAEAFDPVPLDGLNTADAGYAFVVNEALVGSDRNGDGDAVDDVVQLVDERTGAVLAIGDAAPGRAAVRVRSGPFTRPAVVAAGDLVAFLEPEALQGARDANGDGDTFDTVLRAFRLLGAGAADVGGGTPLLADAAPLVDGRALAISGGSIFFRTPEAALARRTTTVLSRRHTGEPVGDSNVLRTPQAISSDGRLLAFASVDDLVVPGDLHCEPSALCRDVFLSDRDADGDGRWDEPDDASVTRVSAAEALAPASVAAVSADGGTVAFISAAATLVPGDTNQAPDVFVYERATGAVERVSVRTGGAQAAAGVIDAPYALAVSRDGTVVAFASFSADLVAGDGNAAADVFVHDRRTHTTERVSVAAEDTQANAGAFVPLLSGLAISGDGSLVVFDSPATNLVPDDDNDASDVFVRDRRRGTTTRVSVGVRGEQANAPARAGTMAPDGSAVAFTSAATNLVPGVRGGLVELYVRDLRDGITTVAGVASDGTPADSSSGEPAFSADGRFVAFTSAASTLVPGDGNALQDVFVHDRLTGLTERVSLAFDGREAPRPPSGGAEAVSPSLPADGRSAVFVHTEDLAQGIQRHRAVFARQPDPDDTDADLSGDGRLDDTVLRVLAPGAGARTLCPAEQVAVAGDTAVFLRPEAAGDAVGCPPGPDLNGDGDAADLVVHLAPALGAVQNLGVAATAIAVSDALVAALVSEADQAGTDWNGDGDTDDRVAAVASGGGWTSLGQAADTIALRGDRAIVITPEADQGADLNGDGDRDDRVLQIGRGDSVVDTGWAVEDFVASDTLVAFRVREAAQGGSDLNGDGDARDDVLFVFDLRTDAVLATGQAVTPCRLEACDPRLPYRPLVDTVRFLTLEADQGADLSDDGDTDDLVLQTFTVAARGTPAAAARTLRAVSDDAQLGAVATLAAVGAGRCAGSGAACALDDACPAGEACLVPPGTCVLDRGTPCRAGDADDCAPDDFCGSDPASPDVTTCRHAAGECGGNADCDRGAQCIGDAQTLQRLAAPLSADRRGAGALPALGRCVETATGRERGTCRSDGECADDAVCRADLLTAGLADRDGDELPDAIDRCPDVPDREQRDTDGDGVGDACDQRTAGNDVREVGEDCDGADDDACPGQCRPDATCHCDTLLPRGIRVRIGHGRARRTMTVRATLPLESYDGEAIMVRLDDAAGNAIATGGVGAVPMKLRGRVWRAAGRGAGISTVDVRRRRSSGSYGVKLVARRWAPPAAAAWARITITAGDRCFAYERRRVPPPPTTTTSTIAPTTSTATSTTTTSSSFTTTTPPPTGVCCGAHRMVLATTQKGRLNIGALPPIDVPIGTRLTLDVGPPDAQCRHAVTIPPGGFDMPATCVAGLFTADVIARGCAGGEALGRGVAWDGHAPRPDPDLHVGGDTRDGVCNPPEGLCQNREREAGGNHLGADVATVGDGLTNAPGLHLAVELPVIQATWDAPAGCPDPDGIKHLADNARFESEVRTMLRLTTGTAAAEMTDRNGDGCSDATGGARATVAGTPAAGPCCTVGQTLTLAGAGVEYGTLLGDVVATTSIPAVVTACERTPGLATCDAVRGGGRVVTSVSEDTDAVRALFPVDGGRVVAVGAGSAAGPVAASVALARYELDGRLDLSFGGAGSGRRRLDVGMPIDVDAATMDATGRIVVVGNGGSDVRHFVVVRILPDGALDPSFGTAGVVRTVIGTSSRAHAVAIQADGRIVVAGDTASAPDLALARYRENGTLDPSFGIGGVMVSDVDRREVALALAIGRDGRLVVGGTSFAEPDHALLLARYLPDGSADPTFGMLGHVLTNLGSTRAELRALVVLDDDGIVATGMSRRPPPLGEEVVVTRHRADGAPEPGFGTNGVARLATGGIDDSANALLVPPDGSIMVAGARRSLDTRALGGESIEPSWDILVARLDGATGMLDPTFGTHGLLVASLGGWADRAFALTRLPDTRLLAGGIYDPNGPHGSEGDFALVRLLPDGHLDPTFNGECAWEEKPLTRPLP